MKTLKIFALCATFVFLICGVSAAKDWQTYSPLPPVTDQPTAEPAPVPDISSPFSTAPPASTIPKAPAVSDANNPFIKLRNEAVAMFKPLGGTITSISGKDIIANIPAASGIKPGMRLDIFRKSQPFLHPVTKQVMGFAEQLVGSADVTAVSAGETDLVTTKGQPMAGDLIRISAAKVPVLFYPDPSVPWSIAEEYYFRLRESDRFDIAEVPVSSISNQAEMLARAKELGAVATIALSYENKGEQSGLTEHILWTDDGAQLLSARETVPPSLASSIAVGESLFMPKQELPVYSFSLPDGYRSVTAGDFGGDGKQVLALTLERRIDFFTLGVAFAPALDGASIKVPGKGINLRLYAADLDHDGRDELIVSAMGENTAMSYIYKYDGKQFNQLWSGPCFLRVMDGALYGQDFEVNGGYKGGIFPVLWTKGADFKGATQLDVPAGATLYSVYPVSLAGTKVYFTFTTAGKLSFEDTNGLQMWQSADYYNVVGHPIESEPKPLTTNQFEPVLMVRMTPFMDSVLAAKRKPLITQIRNVNYYSQMMRVFPNGPDATEVRLIDDVPGTVIDQVLVGDKLVLLSNTWMINPRNLIRLRNIFDMKLLVYKLKG